MQAADGKIQQQHLPAPPPPQGPAPAASECGAKRAQAKGARGKGPRPVVNTVDTGRRRGVGQRSNPRPVLRACANGPASGLCATGHRLRVCAPCSRHSTSRPGRRGIRDYRKRREAAAREHKVPAAQPRSHVRGAAHPASGPLLSFRTNFAPWCCADPCCTQLWHGLRAAKCHGLPRRRRQQQPLGREARTRRATPSAGDACEQGHAGSPAASGDKAVAAQSLAPVAAVRARRAGAAAPPPHAPLTRLAAPFRPQATGG